MSLTEIRDHLGILRQENFDPKTYGNYGYLLHGSIRTDGFRLQVLGFKLDELSCVRYCRLPPERLSDRITSTLAGNDYYLTEVRNVIKSKSDVHRIWPGAVDPHDIKILGIDLGQAFVVGASALPPSPNSRKPRFHNISIKQKAVY